jgi:peroxiredoxin Q/BCP
MLATGTRAPAFELHDQDARRQSLSGLLERGSLILYFYPADFTPGCTKACAFRDPQISSAPACASSVWAAGCGSHRRFADQHGSGSRCCRIPTRE